MAGPQDDLSFFLGIGNGGTEEVDVTSYVTVFEIDRGRDRETDTYRPATGMLALRDPGRRFDPRNTTGPYYGGLTPLRTIRVQVDTANVENYLDWADGHIRADDSANLSVTGDIDVRWFGSLDDWDNATSQAVFNQFDSVGNQRAWMIRFESTGVVFYMSTDGTNQFSSTAVAVPFADNAYGGVRFTRVQSSGLTTCYFSTDGETWNASATTSTLSAGSAIHNSTDDVTVGGFNSNLSSPPTGRFRWAELWNGIEGSGGTLVARPDVSVLLAGRHLFYEPLVDPQGNTWNGFGSNIVVSAGSQMFNGYVLDWLLDYFDGDNLSEVTVPVTDELGLLGIQEIDTIAAAHSGDTSGVRVNRVLDRAEIGFAGSRSVDAGQSTFGATTFGANAASYLQDCARSEGGYLFADKNGVLQFMDRHTTLNADSTLTFVDSYTAAAGVDYLRLTQTSGADLLYNRITGAGTTGTVQSRADTSSQAMYKIRTLAFGDLLNSADLEVADLLQWNLQRFKDPSVRFSSIDINTMSLSGSEAQQVALLDLATVVDVKRTPLGVTSGGYVDLPGTTGNYLSTPDAAALDITGDICIVARIAADDWTPGTESTFVSKYLVTGNQRAYRFGLLTTGAVQLTWSVDGSSTVAAASTIAVGATDGTWKWVAVTLDVNDGAGGRDTRFWTSDDGATWTQLGTAVHGAATTSIFNSSASLDISGVSAGASQPFAGLVSHVSVRDGIGASGTVGGTEVFALRTEDIPADTYTTFPCDTGQTVTVNRSGSPDTLLVPGTSYGTITQTCIVDGVSHRITPGSWETTVRFSNADTRPFLVLDNTTFGRLNSNRLAF